MTRPWLIGSVEMNSHKVMESSKTSEVFIRRKNSTCEQTYGRVQRESCPHDCLNHLDGAFLPVPGSESVFGFSQDPPMCACTSVIQDGF